MEKNKRGRPRTRPETKRITFNLSLEAIKKLKNMTQISKNASALIESLINSHYFKINEQRILNGQN